MSEEEQKTIIFLTDKVKRLELDIQYELHLREELENKYKDLLSKYETLQRSVEIWKSKFESLILSIKAI